MKNIKSYKEYAKVNEEFQIFGMDVVITLGELIEGSIVVIFLVGLGLALGVAHVNHWIGQIIRDKRKRKALKSTSAIILKYKDDIVKDYIHQLRLKVNDEMSWLRGDVAKLYKETLKYIENKMSEEDKQEFNNQMDELGLSKDDYVGMNVKHFVSDDVWERKNYK